MHERTAEAFDEFFRTSHAAMVGLALAMVGDVESARDLAQEAMLRALRDWRRVSRLDRPDMWVRRVTVNLAIDARRRRAREIREVQRRSVAEEGVSADPAVEHSPLWRAVRDLPERQRAAVVLRYVDDLSVPEIALALEVAEGTIKASLSQARASLARRLADAMEVETDG